jgi:spore coat protein U-like protein
MILRNLLLGLAGFLALLLAPGEAQAGCSGNVTVNFGTVYLLDGQPVDITGTYNVTCTLAPSTQYLVCPGIGSTRQMTGGPMNAGTINYQLYESSGRTSGTEWGDTAGLPQFPSGLTMTTDGSGFWSGSVPIYARIFGGQTSTPTTLGASNYSDNPLVSVGAEETRNASGCNQIGATNSEGGSAVISAIYEPSCSLSVSPLNFGSMASTVSGSNASTTIQTTCTPQTVYSISMNYGANGGSGPEARIMSSAGNELVYGIYQDGAHAQPWGIEAGVDDKSGTGTGGNQVYNVYGRILPQTTPPVGVYSDTVVVSVNY